jgi:YVTN family beta-propeller protein
VRRVPLGDDPEIFDLSPDGKTLYVTNEEDAELGIVDLASGKRTGASRSAKEPEGVKVSPDGKTAYVTSEAANLVHVIDLASGKVVKNIKRRQAPAPLCAHARRRAAVGHQRARRQRQRDRHQDAGGGRHHRSRSRARAADITPVGITMTRDGKRAFVGLGKANHVAFVDVATAR